MFKLIEKFEIKSHDGPGRVGKINDAATPKLFFKNTSTSSRLFGPPIFIKTIALFKTFPNFYLNL